MFPITALADVDARYTPSGFGEPIGAFTISDFSSNELPLYRLVVSADYNEICVTQFETGLQLWVDTNKTSGQIVGQKITRENLFGMDTFYQKYQTNLTTFVTDQTATHMFCVYGTATGRGGKNKTVKGYLLIEWAAAGEVNKTALTSVINNSPITGYCTADDRYNGKTTSANGFWADYQSALDKAKAVNENASATQMQVNNAVSALQSAIAKLIPTTQVNATELYERLFKLTKTDKGYKMVPYEANSYTDLEQANYPEEDWTHMETALTHAKELLAALYNKDGTPTDRNWGPAHEGDKPENAITNEDRLYIELA